MNNVCVWRPERHGGVWHEGFRIVGTKDGMTVVSNGRTELHVEAWRVRRCL